MPTAPLDEDWVRQHYERVRRAAWLLTGNAWAADDLTQETFARAIVGWSKFDARASEATWLYSIMLNVHRSQRRAIGRAEQLLRRWVFARGQDSHRSDPRFELATQIWKQSIWAKVYQLPAVQQQAILLRFGEGMTFDQIAEIQKCATGTAQTRVHYGLRKLRSTMDGIDWSTPEPIKLFSSSASPRITP